MNLYTLSLILIAIILSGCQKAVEYPTSVKGKIVVVDGTMTLTEDTVGNQYNIQDDSTLDCNGHAIIASTEGGRTNHAIGLYGNNSNVVNCVIDGYISGISVDSRIPLEEQYLLGELTKEEALEHIDNLQKRAKRNKLVENNTFVNIVKTPVFVQMFARDTTITNNHFDNPGTMSIYLDAYSSGATITHNVIEGSGYNHISGREGIAIDASWDNSIVSNAFSNNNLAAVTLYKNCGEKGMPRYIGANNNFIAQNEFHDEDKGVWIASRADRSRFPDCIDTPIHGNIARDIAQHNTVIQNRYTNTAVAVDIRDDNNAVTENALNNAVIAEGSPTRTAIGDPVSGNIVSDNY